MFCKSKKEYPPGTFIVFPARLMTIVQLSLAFTLIAWHAGYPFMGELFHLKSKLLVYQHVLGIEDLSYAERFNQLPEVQKATILRDYEALQNEYKQPFFSKLKKSAAILLFGIPFFEKLWILLSVIICILLLKRVDGAVQAVWLLPFLVLCFSVENRWYGKKNESRADARLFPTEEQILTEYLNSPLSAVIAEQQRQLSRGWDLYLIREWAREIPSNDADEYRRQKEQGDFAFHLARLEFLKPKSPIGISDRNEKQSFYLLSAYLFWNLSFSLIISSVLAKKQISADPCKVAN
jgi:hypothetical protein